MNNNVSYPFLLLGLFLFLFASCSTNRYAPSKSTTSSRKSPTTKKSAMRDDLVKYALQFDGAGYKYGGNGPKSFDCSGLTCQVFQNFNVAIPRTSSTQATLGKKIRVEDARPGDLAFFSKGTRGGGINHVALIISNQKEGLTVIHSTTSRGVIVDNISHSSYWKPRLLYIRDVIGN